MSNKISNPDKTNYPIRMGKIWQDDEVTQLLTSVQNRKSISEIAKEHERTQGGITSKLRGLAADYFINDQKSIGDIMKLTGLGRDIIIEAIEKKEYYNGVKEQKKNKLSVINRITEPLKVENKPDPILRILQEIQERLETLEMRVDDISARPLPLVKIIRIVKKKIVYGFID